MTSPELPAATAASTTNIATTNNPAVIRPDAGYAQPLRRAGDTPFRRRTGLRMPPRRISLSSARRVDLDAGVRLLLHLAGWYAQLDPAHISALIRNVTHISRRP
jgi:hypothetical protein